MTDRPDEKSTDAPDDAARARHDRLRRRIAALDPAAPPPEQAPGDAPCADTGPRPGESPNDYVQRRTREERRRER